MDTPSDRDAWLLEGLRRGDASAQTLVFQAYEQEARRVLSRILRERSDVLDALQDTFVKVFRNAWQLEDPLALRSWVLRVAQSVGLDEFRRRQRLRVTDARTSRAESPSVVAPVELRSALRDAYRVLSVLPEPEREVFMLRYIDGLELTQIAESCGVSLATVKRRLARASTRFTSLAKRQPGLTDWIGSAPRSAAAAP
ncbi:MAG: RNA polymerase sigma factor [Myxococcota bacterium]